jgi:hypothetical protein
MKRLIIVIVLLLVISFGSSLAKAKIVTLPGLSRPESIELNENNLYVTDGLKVHIFSLSDFKRKKVFGKKGEGPREFKGFILASVQPAHLFISSPNKVSRFSLEGEYIGEKKVGRVFGRLKPMENKYLGYHYSREEGRLIESIHIYSPDFKREKELYRRQYIIDKSGKINLIDERPPIFYYYKKRIYLDAVDGTILVFDNTGERIASISGKYERIAFTEQHKQRLIKRLLAEPQTKRYFEQNMHRMVYSDYFPPVRMFHVADDRIYVMSNKEVRGKNEFFIYDLEGTLLKKVFLPVAPFERTMIPLFYTIRNGKLYKLMDNEETEEWELHIMDIK